MLPGAGARHGQPSQLDREHDGQQGTEPEVRHGDAGERNCHGGLVDGAAAIERAENAERDRDGHRHNHGDYRKLRGRAEPLGDLAPDGRAIAERRAEIADDEPREKVTVLREQRPIETELRAQVAEVRRRRRFTEHRRHRIARDEVDQRKDERRHAEQHWHGQDESPDDEWQHAVGMITQWS